jgi:hypothetical protein
MWITPSESPNAIYAPVGEMAAELIKAGVSSWKTRGKSKKYFE